MQHSPARRARRSARRVPGTAVPGRSRPTVSATPAGGRRHAAPAATALPLPRPAPEGPPTAAAGPQIRHGAPTAPVAGPRHGAPTDTGAMPERHAAPTVLPAGPQHGAPTVLPTVAPPGAGSRGGGGGRWSGPLSTGPSGSTPLRGGGTDDIPPVPRIDPSSALLRDPQVPERDRYCRHGGTPHPVGRGREGRPGLLRGFCPQDGTPYSFAPPLAEGSLVAGQYEVRGALAHGGLGWIYLAVDRNVDDRWVVLKGVLDANDPAALAAARAERQFLAQLSHPNIVAIHNFVRHVDDHGSRRRLHRDGLHRRVDARAGTRRPRGGRRPARRPRPHLHDQGAARAGLPARRGARLQRLQARQRHAVRAAPHARSTWGPWRGSTTPTPSSTAPSATTPPRSSAPSSRPPRTSTPSAARWRCWRWGSSPRGAGSRPSCPTTTRCCGGTSRCTGCCCAPRTRIRGTGSAPRTRWPSSSTACAGRCGPSTSSARAPGRPGSSPRPAARSPQACCSSHSGPGRPAPAQVAGRLPEPLDAGHGEHPAMQARTTGATAGPPRSPRWPAATSTPPAPRSTPCTRRSRASSRRSSRWPPSPSAPADDGVAQRYYELVAAVDPSWADAAFGRRPHPAARGAAGRRGVRAARGARQFQRSRRRPARGRRGHPAPPRHRVGRRRRAARGGDAAGTARPGPAGHRRGCGSPCSTRPSSGSAAVPGSRCWAAPGRNARCGSSWNGACARWPGSPRTVRRRSRCRPGQQRAPADAAVTAAAVPATGRPVPAVQDGAAGRGPVLRGVRRGPARNPGRGGRGSGARAAGICSRRTATAGARSAGYACPDDDRARRDRPRRRRGRRQRPRARPRPQRGRGGAGPGVPAGSPRWSATGCRPRGRRSSPPGRPPTPPSTSCWARRG